MLKIQKPLLLLCLTLSACTWTWAPSSPRPVSAEPGDHNKQSYICANGLQVLLHRVEQQWQVSLEQQSALLAPQADGSFVQKAGLFQSPTTLHYQDAKIALQYTDAYGRPMQLSCQRKP